MTWIKREAPSLFLIAAMFGLSLWAWPHLPARMPMHWNVYGQVDRYGGRVEGLLFVPLFTVGVYTLLSLLKWIEPRREHVLAMSRVLAVIRRALVGLMFLLHGALLGNALGWRVNVLQVMGLGVGALFVVLGNYLPKVPSNFFVGVRTPWTLSSEKSWRQTQRVAGHGLVVIGLLEMVLSALWPRWGLLALLGLLLPGVLAVCVYSYRVWKSDPDRIVPGA